MTKRPSDVLARMKATATREKPVSTDPTETALRPEVVATEDTPPTKPPRVRRVRFTLDLDPEQHKALKRFALEADADASEVLDAGETFDLETHAMLVLREHTEPETEPDHSVAASVAVLSESAATARNKSTRG